METYKKVGDYKTCQSLVTNKFHLPAEYFICTVGPRDEHRTELSSASESILNLIAKIK
jgi:hypothetical protein